MSDQPAGRAPAGSDQLVVQGLEGLTTELLPVLIARLRASRLGELEVRGQGWRVRLRRDAAAGPRPATAAMAAGEAEPPAPANGGVARSPAVGYFIPAPDLVIGAVVQAGDLLGTVDVLGIGQEVTAPADGIVARVLAEEGQAVEFGQALAEIDPLEAELDALPAGEELA